MKKIVVPGWWSGQMRSLSVVRLTREKVSFQVTTMSRQRQGNTIWIHVSSHL